MHGGQDHLRALPTTDRSYRFRSIFAVASPPFWM